MMKIMQGVFVLSLLLLASVAEAAISTDVTPMTSYNRMYPAVSIPSPALTPAGIAGYPSCSAGNLCPGAGCNSVCTVTRTVNGVVNALPSSVQSVTALNCPISYVALTSYNMQQEIIFQPSRPTVSNISSMSDYQNYLNTGYSCYAVNQGYGTWQCLSAYYDYPTQNPPTAIGTITLIDGYVAQYTQALWLNQSGQWQSGYGAPYCFTTGACNVQRPCDPHGASTWMAWTFTYARMQCDPPAQALYYSGNKAPTSLVCGYAYQNWEAATQ